MKSPILSSSFPFAGDIYATTAAARQGVVRGRTDSSVAVPFRIPKQQQHLEDSKRIIRKGKTHTHMRRQLVWKHSGQTSGQKKKGRRQWWIPRKIQSSRIFRRKEEKKKAQGHCTSSSDGDGHPRTWEPPRMPTVCWLPPIKREKSLLFFDNEAILLERTVD